MPNRLTVIIPCKNERKNLRLCVESVRPLADEIIVADSGSSDGTIEIARQLGCRVVEREYLNPASFKNWAIPQASHPWVLLVDADERMTLELAEEIRDVLRRNPPDKDGYWIGFRGFFMGHELRYAGWNTAACRLIRRDVCRYPEGRIHEEMDLPTSRTGRLKGQFLHYSYWTYDEYLRKYTHYTRLGAMDLHDRGRRATFGSLLVRPMLRFVQMYLLRGGFLDGLPGLQVCMLTAFFNTFMKQARLWELHSAHPQPDPEAKLEKNRAA
jgi:glycosyltransferase involved in cell wall biosynthesis